MSVLFEPNWRVYKPFLFYHLNPILLDWLLEPGSLTARLKTHCKHFQVEVLQQKWSSIFLSERLSLSVPERSWANVREVKLLCDGKPWVYARSIIPRSTLTGKERSLLALGTKPLGHILFEHPDMRRSPFEIALIKPEHYQFQGACVGGETKQTILYGRRSIFYLEGKPLSVSEVFTKNFPFAKY